MISDDPQYYIDGVLDQNRQILAKTITLIESSLPSHQELGGKVLDQLLSHTGKGIRLGVTGIPGAGKSTFIESLGSRLIEKGHRVAVLAVDPSSSRSGGSILADKTRMERLSTEEGAYIRPSPSGGTLGGVARKTRETMLVCEAAGFDVAIVETVGVGQSETTVSSMVDFFLVLMISGAGDELQGIKKGVLELADAVAINKADGNNIKKAEIAKKEYENALHLLNPASPTWTTPVLTCSAIEMTGVDEIWSNILLHKKKMVESGEFEDKRKKQALEWMWSLLEEGLKERFFMHPEIKKILPGVVRSVEKGLSSPSAAVNKFLFVLDKGL
ncbi:MAG: methylmalonyl Co-A mutase-associated GTPase MeaB [Desulfobacterales bacterium]|jgi:LAO/AO transport system kinase|nr:methylmalonyl Co-A mutase-associated GTPase MeaB [Desulfobacteraceae bacterium]MBT4365737.1 methylmalonyl Co-A mutase-associated GTPase MeaB [Desulfobacteraceae bacterium]MBT7086427.1 methylmalonyl Co-A mutase-associated GTPase MeaB [Desulfobacterales bacterium]MBT7698412.1 methylmalonyl Co-A mutase-associated GTPase MeaB [Desulfobacterales bacterium]